MERLLSALLAAGQQPRGVLTLSTAELLNCYYYICFCLLKKYTTALHPVRLNTLSRTWRHSGFIHVWVIVNDLLDLPCIMALFTRVQICHLGIHMLLHVLYVQDSHVRGSWCWRENNTNSCACRGQAVSLGFPDGCLWLGKDVAPRFCCGGVARKNFR